MKKKILLLLLSCGVASFLMAANDVRIISLFGPISTAQIAAGDGSATAYRMDTNGQDAICFQTATAIEVYIGSHSAITNSDGWGLYNKGDNLCADLKNGTTLYFYGSGGAGDVRAFIIK